MAGLGLPELLIILVILLLVFGPKRLPGLGRQLGGGMREFKDSITHKSSDDDESDDDESEATTPAGLPAPPASATPAAGEAAPRTPEHGGATPPRA